MADILLFTDGRQGRLPDEADLVLSALASKVLSTERTQAVLRQGQQGTYYGSPARHYSHLTHLHIPVPSVRQCCG